MNNCRICNSKEMMPILSGLQTRLGEVYSLVQCKECDFISTHPVPDPNQLKRYYDQDYWQNCRNKTGGLLEAFYKLRMNGTIKTIKKMVPAGSRVLDWGAGDGSLLRLLEAEGFEVAGIDIYSNECFNRKLINASIKSAPFQDEFFDAITCFHVLEHIDDPVSSIEKAMQLVKPGGILVFEVPNVESIGFKIFSKNWYPLDIPVHLNHFSTMVMKRMFNNIGNTRILKIEYFSHRHSSSSLLLSLMPAISPPRVRARHSGHFPLSIMFLYLLLQLTVYPLAIMEAFAMRGEIIRMYVRKSA